MTEPSTKCSKRSAIARAVAGLIAFASMYRPWNPASATADANSAAAPGGQIDTMASALSTISASAPTSVMPRDSARVRVWSLRPALAHNFVVEQFLANVSPISPGCRNPTFITPACHRSLRNPRRSTAVGSPTQATVASRQGLVLLANTLTICSNTGTIRPLSASQHDSHSIGAQATDRSTDES